MFKTKYKKAMKILDLEIEKNQTGFNNCANYNADMYCLYNSRIHDEMILQNLNLMDKYQNKIDALWDLKKRLQMEIGV